MKTSSTLAVVAVLVSISMTTHAPGAVTATFATGLGDWIADFGAPIAHDTTAGDDANGGTGFARVTHVGFVQQDGFGGTVRSHTDDLAAKYGEGLTELILSFDFKVISGDENLITGFGWEVTNVNGSGGWARQNFGSIPPPVGDWQHVETVIDTTWSDVQAMANGWAETTSSHVTTWANALADVGRMRVGTLLSSNSNVVIGYDNISIQAIPEPATVALLALSSVLLAFKRRRQ